MSVNKSTTYSAGFDAVFAELTDADKLTARYNAMGNRNISVNVSANGDTVTVATKRDVQANPPGFAKKFLAEWNSLDEKTVWTKSAGSANGSYTSQVPGVPGGITGTIGLSGDDASSSHNVSMTAEIKVPLVGKKIAAVIEEDIAKSMDEDFNYTKSTLGA